MANRKERKETAQETLRILDRGHYFNSKDKKVEMEKGLKKAREETVLYRPQDFGPIFEKRDRILEERPPYSTEFSVENTTTLKAAHGLWKEKGEVLALNFASARNPGGGFLGGSQAQEESLARASGLYYCLLEKEEMYEYNREHKSCLYSDHMIYSPQVPVFRDDEDQLLDSPYSVSFLTAPAVNAGVVRRRKEATEDEIETVMLTRMEKVLAVAVAKGHENIVLGAWGCGVFQNLPRQVAQWFGRHLLGKGRYQGGFKRVFFAVLDRTGKKKTIEPFLEIFGNYNHQE